jgi:4-hydroxy-3-methylbut-2-enyl diphosphate reductase
MCALEVSFVRNDASIDVSLSRCPCVTLARQPTASAGTPSTLSVNVSPPSVDKPAGPSRVLLAAPRGYCAGVDRAVETVEHALDLHGEPIYVRKEIVHNKHVVEELEKRGAIFVEETTEIPEGEMVVFSAHGVAPSVHESAAKRQLRTIDATCPLVTKVHVEARRFAEQGYTIFLIGHEGHEEVEGTMGEAPANVVLVQTEEEVDTLEVDDPDRTAYITQTTLSVDETTSIIAALKRRFPNMTGPKTDDICYATTNRQMAVKDLARKCELVLVIGSTNSSNSNRLVEVAREHGASSYLIDNHLQVDESWLDGVETVGITSGASAPEELVERLISYFRERGASDISELRTVEEDVRFMLPSKIRKELAGAAESGTDLPVVG